MQVYSEKQFVQLIQSPESLIDKAILHLSLGSLKCCHPTNDTEFTSELQIEDLCSFLNILIWQSYIFSISIIVQSEMRSVNAYQKDIA